MKAYYDPSANWAQVEGIAAGLTRDAARFDAAATRLKAQRLEKYQPGNLRRYALRPLETVWAYYTAVRPVWNEPRPGLWAQCWEGNTFFLTRFQASASPEGPPFYFTPCLSDDHLLAPDAVAVPLRLKAAKPASPPPGGTGDLFGGAATADPDAATANLSSAARDYLNQLGLVDPDTNEGTASLLWMHALAVGFSPAYLAENEAGIRTNYPRVPLPAKREELEASAALGHRIAALLNTEVPAPGITTGKVLPELRVIGRTVRADRKAELNPSVGDLAVTAGWGARTKSGVMPGRGDARVREYTPPERAALTAGVHADAALLLLGDRTFDIYLNEFACWENVPTAVWEYTIGGYQVIKKWLSYRERDVLGRDLTVDEAREVMGIIRRIAALLLLGPELDSNYRVVKAETYPWPDATADATDGAADSGAITHDMDAASEGAGSNSDV